MSLLILIAIVFGGLWLVGKGYEIDQAPMTYERYAQKTDPIMLWIFGTVAVMMLMGLCAHSR